MLDKIFNNISKTLKITGKVFWWIGVATILGALVFWPISFALYGLGEMLEKQEEANNILKYNATNVPPSSYENDLPEI